MTEGWGVFEAVDDGCAHVAPITGRRHVMSMGCWCYPRLDSQSTRIVIHYEEDEEVKDAEETGDR